jgi:hypothetical protein
MGVWPCPESNTINAIYNNLFAAAYTSTCVVVVVVL